jgi:lipoprotein-anchoring transpeptidase ErfK/SrfK
VGVAAYIRAMRARELVVAVACAACGDMTPPPGRTVEAAAEPPVLAEPSASEPAAEPAPKAPPVEARIASIAMRTWIYLEPDDDAQKLGYLRAGAVVPRSAEPAGTQGCEGGWYQIEPRGYVCNGKGASLELDHPVVQAAMNGPRRGEPMPYRYVISKNPPPHLYFKLPTVAQQESAEGKDQRAQSVASFAPAKKALGDFDPIPKFLQDGDPLPKPYGAERPLHYLVHRGRAREESAFGLIATFDWIDRALGLTTELDLVALDRTRVVHVSPMHGVVVDIPNGVPGFVFQHAVSTYKLGDRGELFASGTAPYRSGWVLTGQKRNGLAETTAGVWLPEASMRVAKVREDNAGFAKDGKKWIDVSIKQQLLVAYEGKRIVYATLVSTGRGDLGDPEKTHATVRGTFMIHSKHVSGTMDGNSDIDEQFDLRDVPYIQYFHMGYAIHGAYWHDEFGKSRSHGCINVAPTDAAWLFEWTDPRVPEGWHAALNLNAGTLVWVHA